MNKEKVREYKLREIDRLRDEINTIATLEQDRYRRVAGQGQRRLYGSNYKGGNMNKEKVREYKLREIDRLRDEINTIATLEQDRVYKWERRSWGTGEPDPIIEYGILETFNQESMCFRVLASNVENNRYEDPWSSNWRVEKNYRFNITKVPYHRTLIPVKKSEIPVMVTSKWVSKELMEIMKGTSRKKCIL